jgi:hypothetical protein
MRCGDGAQDNYAYQDAEKVRQQRSRLIEILNVPQKGTPPVSTRLRPCWTAFLSILSDTIVSRYLLNARERTGVSKCLLPTVAPVVWSIVAQTVEERRVIIWRPKDPGATQVEAESHRGIGIEGRDRLHDSGWLCQVTVQIGIRGGLAVELTF